MSSAPSLRVTNLPLKGRGQGHMTHFHFSGTQPICLELLKLEASNFVHME